eukprot:maker-scaffold_7-snap-gene-16.9-mRNA-1 protein AED:0.28 eAED:0.28 QI:8/1/1/1/1/1/2/302/144
MRMCHVIIENLGMEPFDETKKYKQSVLAGLIAAFSGVLMKFLSSKMEEVAALNARAFLQLAVGVVFYVGLDFLQVSTFVKAMKDMGPTVGLVSCTVINIVFTSIFSYFIYEEGFSLRKFLGLVFLIFGVIGLKKGSGKYKIKEK